MKRAFVKFTTCIPPWVNLKNVYKDMSFYLKLKFFSNSGEDIRPISRGKKAQDARKECWDGTGIGNNIGFWECHTQGGNQLFKYIPDKHHIFHVPSNGCATADSVRFFIDFYNFFINFSGKEKSGNKTVQ